MSERRGCFKVGCLGCLGVGGLILVVLVLLAVLGWLTGGGDTRIEALDRAHELPEIERTIVPGRHVEGGQPSPARIDERVDVNEPGRIVLDLNRGRFEIVPGPAGEPIRVEGRYDAGRFDLEESYETYGESGWIFRVKFDQKGFGLQPFVEHDGMDNRVRLIVPRDVPIVLEGRVGIGESELELGGLWVLSVDLDIGIGEHTVGFAEALPVPMNSLRLDTSIGVLNVDRLGNASPVESWVKHSVGETRVDLRGAWRLDAEVDVVCGIGECDVRVPKDVEVDLRRVGVTIGEASRPRQDAEPPPGAPTLQLSVSATIGEVRVH